MSPFRRSDILDLVLSKIHERLKCIPPLMIGRRGDSKSVNGQECKPSKAQDMKSR